MRTGVFCRGFSGSRDVGNREWGIGNRGWRRSASAKAGRAESAELLVATLSSPHSTFQDDDNLIACEWRRLAPLLVVISFRVWRTVLVLAQMEALLGRPVFETDSSAGAS